MFFWTEQSIKWFCEASEYSDFHHDLGKLVGEEINPDEVVCDLGCGLGYLTSELGKYCRSVMAIDSDEKALAELRKRQPNNVTVICADVDKMPCEAICDTLVLSFFGRITENKNLDKYLSFCRNRLIAVVSGSAESSISPTGHSRMEKERPPKIAAFLDERKIPFHFREAELEFGQPFKTLDDAAKFIQYYAKDSTMEEAFSHAKRQLKNIDNGYYLPYHKKLGIFTIEK